MAFTRSTAWGDLPMENQTPRLGDRRRSRGKTDGLFVGSWRTGFDANAICEFISVVCSPV